MARSKGIIQKRDESKYWLPEGIQLKDNQTAIFNKTTKLVFIDNEFGEFISYFKALHSANASTHPLSVQKRREATNTSLYGGKNPSNSKDIRTKAKNTMKERYGVEHALLSKEFLDKSKATLKINHNVDNPMNSKEIKAKQQLTMVLNHGVNNPMKSESVKEQLKSNMMQKYGVDNPAKHAPFKEKALETLTQNGSTMSSKGELELKSFVESLGLTVKNGYIGGANPKQIDLKINELDIGIEYNGAYWHSEANKNMHKNYHKEKMLSANSQGMRLIQIFDFEWINRNEQVKSFLKSALGKNTKVIYARNTEIKEIPKKEAQDFLNKYHILGKCNFVKAYGLTLNNELLCLLTVGKHHRNTSEFVLSRFVGKEDTNVIGGLSKLTKLAVNEFGSLSTWIDLRFSDGLNWISNGWELENTLTPDYFYLNIKTGKIVSKQSRRKKKVNTPDTMTEHQHALNDGLRRIYDCGKIKLRIK